MDFLTLIDYIGTFAFAISGIRLASAKRFDWFGAYVVGFVTAVGGGDHPGFAAGRDSVLDAATLLFGSDGGGFGLCDPLRETGDPAEQYVFYF